MITFDKKQSRYRDAKGRFISEKQIHEHIEKVTEKVRTNLREIGTRYLEHKNIAQFQIEMKEQLKTAHILTSAIGKGGRKNMGLKDWGKVGAELSKQYKFVNNFARDIENKKVSDVQLLNRAQSYAKSVRTAFYVGEKETKQETKTEAKRILHAVESCSECLVWANKWIPIDEMPDIGTLICKSFCRCEIIYR